MYGGRKRQDPCVCAAVKQDAYSCDCWYRKDLKDLPLHLGSCFASSRNDILDSHLRWLL